MSYQVALTVRATIRSGEMEALKDLLTSMSAEGAHNAVLPFDALPCTHFARLLVVEGGTDAPSLLLMLDCDAPVERRLHDLVRIAGRGLDELFRHCEDYPPEDGLTTTGRLRYLRSRMTSVE